MSSRHQPGGPSQRAARGPLFAATARRLPLDARKSLERAARATTEAAGSQDRVNATLGALVTAINAARERHEANAVALQARGEEIRARAEEVSALGPLRQSFAAKIEEASKLN